MTLTGPQRMVKWNDIGGDDEARSQSRPPFGHALMLVMR